MKTKPNDCAFIVGRFQTHILHTGQIELIQSVIDTHKRTCIILGNSVMRGTLKNPLDYRSRRTMIQEKFPNIDVLYITDIPLNDSDWSKSLDSLIKTNTTDDDTVCVYGSKETVVSVYTGKHTCRVLEASSFISDAEIRRNAATDYPATESYRAGIVSAGIHRFPTAYQTVDVAIVDTHGRVLLCRKPTKSKFQFIGGFSDPTSSSLEIDVKRETMEETGVEVDNVLYIGSTLIKRESRYFNEFDKIKTAFFVGKYIYGRPTANDDIAEVRWFTTDELTPTNIESVHEDLVNMYFDKFVKNNLIYNNYLK